MHITYNVKFQEVKELVRCFQHSKDMTTKQFSQGKSYKSDEMYKIIDEMYKTAKI